MKNMERRENFYDVFSSCPLQFIFQRSLLLLVKKKKKSTFNRPSSEDRTCSCSEDRTCSFPHSYHYIELTFFALLPLSSRWSGIIFKSIRDALLLFELSFIVSCY